MPLIVTTSKYEETFHVGDKIPRWYSSEVKEIQANGDELEHILSKNNNIPTSSKRVVRWYGDHAKFIVGNW